MSKKQWLVLLMLFLTYLLLGAFIFYHIEGHHEIEQIAQAKLERIEINGEIDIGTSRSAINNERQQCQLACIRIAFRAY